MQRHSPVTDTAIVDSAESTKQYGCGKLAILMAPDGYRDDDR